MILRARTIAAALISCAALAACSSGPHQGPADSPAATPGHTTSPAPTPASPTPGTSTPASPTAPAPPPKPPDRGDVLLGDLDTRSFSYAGGCGFEVPAAPVKLVDGKQADKTPGFNGRSSRAEWTRSKQITLGGQQYLLVYLTCTVGSEKLLGAHLIGLDHQKPTDLGIIATGSRITAGVDHDQLDVDVDYRTLKDRPGHASGSTSYKITVAGLTPVRLFPGEQRGDIDPAITKLSAHAYDAGLVGISGYVDDPSETSWVVGLLDRPKRVLTSDSLGGGYDSGLCWKPTVYTQAGERIGHTRLAYNGNDHQTGTAIDLAKPSRAEPGVRGKIAFPVRTDTSGLLIPANGVVPALATATTRTAANGQGDALVTTKAPADAYADIDRFGAASGSEYPLPIGAFATADGRIALTGAWFNAPVAPSDAASGMRPIVDPADLGEKTCSS